MPPFRQPKLAGWGGDHHERVAYLLNRKFTTS
jgi:hypothetical protein